MKTRVVIETMYYKRPPRVRLEDGTLGLPTEALDKLRAEPASEGQMTSYQEAPEAHAQEAQEDAEGHPLAAAGRSLTLV